MITRARTAISRQLSHPSGVAGRVIAALMNRGNRDLNARAIDLLDVRPGDRVLDLGFGGGATFPVLLRRGGTVIGVDRAGDMVHAARDRYRTEVAAGRVVVQAGDIAALPLEDGGADRILTVNTIYFWPDLPPALRELRRVLVPGGRIVIGIRDGSVMDRVTPDLFTLRTPAEICDALSAAGFADAHAVSAADGRTHLLTATTSLR